MILPSFVSEGTQRDLIRWSLDEHARPPNETNLDAHYFLPPSGLWSTYLHSSEAIIQPRASSLVTSPPPVASGPRQLISNTPASPATFSLLRSTPRPPPAPSIHAQPLSAAELIPRLRWANIGWSYHWGTKLYDFTREVQPVGEPFRRICIEVVHGISWHDVFGGSDVESLGGWGDDGPDWQAWEETYGQYSELSSSAFVGGVTQFVHLQSPTRALLTFTKQKTPSWVMSTALRSVPLHHLSRSRELPPSPLFIPIRSLICGPLPASETPQSSSSVVSRATLRQSRSCCALVTSLSCPGQHAVVRTTVFHAYSRERYQLISGRVPISMIDCGHRMRST